MEKKVNRKVVRESHDTIEAVKSALKSGKIDKKEAQRRMYAIADNDIRDADNNDAEMMDEADEVGTVEVERELDTADLPIQHADEDLVELPVFVVANPDLSDSEFFMVVDNDGDADDGVTIAKLTEDLQEVDHEATLELANELAARLGATAEVVNINALGVDAPDTVGDEGVLDEDGELLLDNDPEGDINEPVQGGFEVVANADGTVTFLGDVAELVSELAGDAAGEVMSELSEMPLVDDNLNSMIESAKSKLSAKQKRLTEASEEDFARVVAEHFGVDVEDVEVSEWTDAGVDYAEVTVNGEEYSVFESYDDAEKVAISRVEEDVANQPSLFPPDTLIYHMYISDIDKRMMATDEADALVSDMSDDEIIDAAGMRDEYDEAVDAGDDSLAEEILDDAKASEIDRIEDQVIDQYGDIQGYFMDELGYSMEQLMDASWIQIDEREIAEEAVDIEGVAHFLAGYDGNEVDLPDGFVAYRTN